MHKGILSAVVVLGLTATVPAEDVKNDLAKLEGTWVAASATHNGKEVPPAELKEMKLTIKGDTYTLETGKEPVKGTLKVDSGKTPKTINAVRKDGSALEGVYELGDDTFKVCFAAPKKDRPTALSAGEGSGNRLTVWKRAK
jgi:uncharacterized protein (TIGR03067 family)